MKQVSTKDKLSRNKAITDGRAAMLFRDLIRPVLSRIAGLRVPYKVIIEQPYRPMKGKAVIYAANHFCFGDCPIMGRIVPKRAYILTGKQRMGFSDRLFFALNGAIFVDRKDREDMAASKEGMAAYLKKGRDVVAFPEGTWNMTENRLMLPMKWGIIDIARETGAQIIPVILDYDREKNTCAVRFEAPMVFVAADNRAEGIARLRDTMASARWEFMERSGVFRRDELDMAEERKRLFYSVEEYPSIEWEYESSCIYHPHTEPEEAFAHLKRLIPCRENAFLFRGKV